MRAGGSRATAKRAARAGASLKQPPYRRLRNPYRPVETLSADALEAIHHASLRLLQEHGLEFMDGEALAILAAHGAQVDHSNGRVRFDPALVLERVAMAPSEITLHARNPDHSVTLGANHIVFGAVAGPPNCSDLDRGRRPGTFKDFLDLVRLAQSLNAVHVLGGAPVAPIDRPPATRHLQVYRAFITETDKAWQPQALGAARIRDGIAMNRIARGIDEAEMRARPGVMTIVNTNSPRRVDGPMLAGMTEMALSGQVTVVTPFTLAGAMAPVTLAGALAQQNAEALGVIAYLQMVAPGSPAVYGGFTSNVDMKSGAPAFGTPEYAKAVMAGAQLARRYRLPYRSSNVNAANALDAQAAYETMMSLWATVMGHANLVYHGAGWLEGGLVASFEKMVLDAELIGMMAALLDPVDVSDEALGLAAIAEVGPGGHSFGNAHTLARYESAFHAPMISDWRNFESWREAGAPTADIRANAIWKGLLADFEAPALEPARLEALDAYIARREPELVGDPPP